MRKTTLSLAACVLALASLAGCGDDTGQAASEPSPSPSPSVVPTPTPSATPGDTPTPTPLGTVINATIRGDDIDPNGERIKVKIGEEITINVDSDRAGELHVHSTPEQELEYGVGLTTLRLKFTTPGIIEVEDHVAEKVLVSLQVS